jgi:hypothetical protein
VYNAPISLFEEEGGEELVVPMETFKILEQVHLAALLLLLPLPPQMLLLLLLLLLPLLLLIHPILLRSMKRP